MVMKLKKGSLYHRLPFAIAKTAEETLGDRLLRETIIFYLYYADTPPKSQYLLAKYAALCNHCTALAPRAALSALVLSQFSPLRPGVLQLIRP
jgi:hypothetical protein